MTANEQCLRYALATGQEYGVWGGTSEEERKVLRRRLRVGSALARPAQLAAAARRRGRACAG